MGSSIFSQPYGSSVTEKNTHNSSETAGVKDLFIHLQQHIDPALKNLAELVRSVTWLSAITRVVMVH